VWTEHVNEYDKIAARFAFQVPEIYRAMRARGCFDHTAGREGSLVHESPNELFLTDLQWMTLQKIAEFQPPSFQIAGLVPFASSARRDLFCWYPAWTTEKGVPVTFCPRDDENAICYAGDFCGFLYRILLEEFSGSWNADIFGIDGLAERFHRYAKLAGEFLPVDWANKLIELSARPLTELEEGVHGVMERAECEQLIQRALSFPRLNERFKHYV
jgi:hypothetical protein